MEKQFKSNLDKNCCTLKLHSVFYEVNDLNIKAKSALIGLCSEIDRFLLFSAGYDVTCDYEVIDREELEKAFPNFKRLSPELTRQYFDLFRAIRNNAAHVYSNKDIQISKELEDALSGILEPTMPISADRSLTYYGCAYVLSFVSIKSFLWPFITEYFDSKHTGLSKDELSKMQTDTQHHLQSWCSKEKPYVPPVNNINPVECRFLGDLIKRDLTKVLFQLEMAIVEKKTATGHNYSSFRQIMNESSFCFSSLLRDKLIELRNLWLHGTVLFEETQNPLIPVFDLETVTGILFELKEACEKWPFTFERVLKSIDQVGADLLDFTALRLFEVSYKVLDAGLFEKEKMNERVTNSVTAFNRVLELLERGVIGCAEYLYGVKTKDFVFSPSKFKDKKFRRQKGDKFKIIVLESDTGFSIGGAHILSSKICCVDLSDLECKNQINGMDLDKINLTYMGKAGSYFDIYHAKI